MILVLPLSKDRRRISWRLVVIAIGLQFLICWLMLRAPFVKEALLQLNMAVAALGAATLRGSSFVFGYLGGGEAPFSVTNSNHLVVFAFQVLPLLIVMSALSALLWYWRILPLIIQSIAMIFEKALAVRGPAGLVTTANIFLGQTEAPLLVRPYLAGMSRHELLLVMTAGMATIAGSVMVIYSAMLMGVDWDEAAKVGSLLGVKSVLNEFVAYIQLSAMPAEALSDRSRLIAMYALCGFANLASIGIQISGIGSMAPERRSDLAALAWPAFVAATMASCMNASVLAIVTG